MKHKDLLEIVVCILDSFNPKTQAVQGYVQSYAENIQGVIDEDVVFLEEVFSGCIRYQSSISVVVNGYFHNEVGRKTCMESDRNVYKALTYLMLFRLDELGVEDLKEFIESQNTNLMYKFLAFFLDEAKLKTWIFAEWCKAYEHSFVMDNLLCPILRWLPELNQLLKGLKMKLANVQKKREVQPTTEIEAFNLTKPKTRAVSIPEKIPTIKKHQPAPKSTYKSPKELEKLQEIKERNKIKSQKNLLMSTERKFQCANVEKSEKTTSRMKTYMQEEEEKLNFDKIKAIPLPTQTKSDESASIRLNAAAIMREGRLLRQREAEENRRLDNLLTGGRDATNFLEWQHKMKEKDLEDELSSIERRRLDGKISYEEAILARQTLVRDKKTKVEEIKKETKEIMEQFLEQKFKEEQEMRILVEQTMQGHENVKEAKNKLTAYKQSIVAEVNKESRELMAKALEKAEKEMREKIALIASIRAIESVPRIRFKFVDLTETSGAGLLGEMSVAELRERLRLLKIAEQKEEESKRNEILQAKMDKDQMLIDTLESIAKHRVDKERVAKLEENKLPVRKSPVKDAKLIALQDKLSAKRAEREKYQLETSPPKSTNKHKKPLKAKLSADDVKWRELERDRRNAARMLQQMNVSSES